MKIYRIACALNAFVLLSIIAGCTVKGGEVVGEDKNKIMDCTDIRDGDIFSFNTNSITNIRLGIGSPNTADIVTLSGKNMTISSGMESYIKCTKRRAY